MIDRLVVWGGTKNLDSFRWIMRGFFETAHKMGIPTRWVDDDPASVSELTPGSTVIAADVTGRYLPAVPYVNYVLHNFSADHPSSRADHILRLQVWTNDAYGEQWATFRKFEPIGGVLFQPWGTNLLAEEFLDPAFNNTSRDVVHVGAIWSDHHPLQGEMGNEDAIRELRRVLSQHNLLFVHLTQVPEQQMVDSVRQARFAPSIAGEWQQRVNYLPCRYFKNISYGALGISNVPALKELVGDAYVPGDSIEELVENALSLRRTEYLDMVRTQQVRISDYSYRENLLAIGRAIEELR